MDILIRGGGIPLVAPESRPTRVYPGAEASWAVQATLLATRALIKYSEN